MTATNPALDAAREYLRRGWSVVPLPVQSKAPVIPGWNKLRLTEGDLPQHFTKSGNIGVVLGQPSGGLVDIDLDSGEALALADRLLPMTRSEFGRKSKPRSHRLYICGPPARYVKYTDPTNNTTLAEVRTSGEKVHQTIFPPSVHPSGETVEWRVNGEPLKIRGDELAHAVARLAAAALLARHWPPQGTRHEAHLALAGMLLRAGWRERDVTEFCEALSSVTGDGKQREHAANVRDTAGRLAKGENTTGAARLGEAVGAGVVAAVREWLGLAEPPRTGEETVWDAAESMSSFLEEGEDGADFLDPTKRILARASVTEIFSPRGLGKSLFALELVLRLANNGLRVLLLDRDNPRHVVRFRLRSFGAEPTLPLKVLSREKCPPLTDTAAWGRFPYEDYDAVIVDSLDSAAEGIGEQDSAKPSRAMATLLDVARRENGPAVLVLGNCVRSGQHSRGSGVVEDRADIVYEVRDATGFRPTGSKPWWEELPPADSGSWAARSSRRRQQTVFRLALIASKFRIGEEPEPFAVELDLSSEPWTVRDVTNELDQDGASAREQRIRERAELFGKAEDALVAELQRRAAAGQPAMLKDRDAIPFLTKRGLKRAEARELLIKADRQWAIIPVEGQKGHPLALLLAGKNEVNGGNTPSTEPAETQAISDADSRRPHLERTAEMRSSRTGNFRGDPKTVISAEASFFSPQTEPQEMSEGEL